ncbi:MAG: hypothetical protein ACYCVB_06655 [Bacilli bacterium]
MAGRNFRTAVGVILAIVFILIYHLVSSNQSASTPTLSDYYDTANAAYNNQTFLSFQGVGMGESIASLIRDSTGYSSMDGTGQMPGTFQGFTWGRGWSAFTLEIVIPKNVTASTANDPITINDNQHGTLTDSNLSEDWTIRYNPSNRVAKFSFAISPSGNTLKPLDLNAGSLLP